MKCLLLWLFSLGSAIGVCSLLCGHLKVTFRSQMEKFVIALALAHGFLAYLVFIVGSLGALNKWVVLGLVTALFLLTLKQTMRFCAELGHEMRRGFSGMGIFERILFAVSLVVAFFALAGALAPAIGQDELCYHLMQPKNYVRAGAIYEVALSLNSLWPYLMEMLFTFGVLLDGAELAKLFHFSMSITAVLAAYSFTRRYFDQKTAFYSAALFWLTPAVFIQSSFAYIDNALAAYVFLAVYAWIVYRDSRETGWALLAGIFTGLAISTKLTGLIVVPVLLLLAAWDVLRGPERGKVARTVGLAAVTAFLAGGVWYVRAWILRGNPVFPFFPKYFGGHGWDDPTYINSHGGGQHFFDFLSFPWDLTMHPEWFGGEHIGVLYLMLLPLVVFSHPPKALKALMYCLAAYSLFWFKLDPNVRFFFPGLLLACPVAAHALINTSRSMGVWWRRGYFGIIGVLFILQAAFAVHHFRNEAELFFRPDKEKYLRSNERSYFAAMAINKKLSANDKILSVSEPRGYYFDNAFVLEGDMTRFTRYDEKLSGAGEVRDYLRSLGFTHVLMTEHPGRVSSGLSPARIGAILESGTEKDEFFKVDLIVGSGKARYLLYRIL